MKNILIIGSGSQARYVIDILRDSKESKIVGLIDIESAKRVGQSINGIPIRHSLSDIPGSVKPADHQVIIAYGKNEKKKQIAEQFSSQGFSFASAVSSHAVISPSAEVGNGCIINPGAVVMPNAKIGNHVIIHSQCLVEHDNVIGDYSNLAPGVILAGRVTVGEGATLYTGVRVIPDIRIESWAMVAAGSLVTKNVPASSRVGGSPARPMAKIGK